ncbi:putative outer membrane protein [Formosa agariphila KMM 3901]|uniref:Putative outer membrane protein n=1 Tax=Formosa agariphila (strain DSM 15362 / KCTC 12365 / LMG 23005 / KMM 3901 / M-2Alg 35-1) TaxID=1347342 RepID=T2KQG3_FORAG|nr:membrane protein [Formosa agariphila]CDF80691.1 putative outer membrane protein [Formosa agariphila KMM 3901]
MIKKLVLVFIAAFAVNSYAQEGGTASPYSYYGIGNLKFKGTVENKSMGGLSIYSDSIHVNLRNPASYASENLKMYNNEGRPVKFAIGGSHTNSTIKGQGGSDDASSSTFDYIALSLPVGRFGFGFGLLPYSSVGYKLETNYDNGNLQSQFNGEGGLNKAYISAAYLVTKGLSVGVDASYGFGNIKNTIIDYVYDADGLPLSYQTRQNNRSDLSGLGLNFGATYKTRIYDKFEWVSSVTFAPSNTIKSKNSRTFSTVVVDYSGGTESVVNTIDGEQTLIDNGELETEVELASRFSIGTGIGQERHWFVGVETTFENTSNFNERPTDTGIDDGRDPRDVEHKNPFGLSVGGFYIPKYNAFNGYWNRVVYRAGFRTEKTGLVINGQEINEFGISFGAGLPLGTIFSNANLGFEFGRRGTTDYGLIQENFFNFSIGLSLNDRWFVKRKYD